MKEDLIVWILGVPASFLFLEDVNKLFFTGIKSIINKGDTYGV